MHANARFPHQKDMRFDMPGLSREPICRKIIIDDAKPGSGPRHSR